MSSLIAEAPPAVVGARAAVDRIAVVNRGEAAMRLIRAVRERNAELGTALRTIAVHTEPDRRALFVREADEAVCIGPAITVAPDGRRRSTYLDLDAVARALSASRASAAWVGWGFVAEQAEFAELCERLGVVFMGPSAEAMRALGDKIRAKQLAEACGLPVGAWSGGAVATAGEAHDHAARLGYPLVIKAAGGGGGRGIRSVAGPEGLAEAFESARAEARAAFGDPTVLLERLVPAGRHVEVQIVGDGMGTTWALGVRDCSVQRRHQKIVEESASTALTGEQVRLLRDSARRLCDRVGYRGPATVEFLLDAVTGTLAFMEVNTRLQVEHPVTEMTTGVDIVKLQLDLAAGGRLAGGPPPARGHAVEVRLCAEDADRDFAPAPGVIELLRLPAGPGIRVDSGVAEGDEIPPEFDSMIAKVIAWGQDRAESLARLRRAVAETAIVVRGGTTNRAFLHDILAREEIRTGTADIGWLDRVAAAQPASRAHADLALLVAAVEVDQAELAVERTAFYAAAARGRPITPDRVGRSVELRMGGHAYALTVFRMGPREFRVEADGRCVDVDVERRSRFERLLTVGGQVHRAVCVEQAPGFLVEVDGVAHRVTRDDGGLVRSPAPAVVAAVRVAVGDGVAPGDVLAVLEAMKLETPVRAPFAGTVSRVLVVPNIQVDTGAPLLQVDVAPPETGAAAVGERAVLAVPAGGPDGRPPIETLRRLMLGYEVDARTAREELARRESPDGPSGHGDAASADAEDDVLRAFADICSLSRPSAEAGDEAAAVRGSAQENLFAFLRSLDEDAVPQEFAQALRRAVAHYGVQGLERTPDLEECLYRIVRSHHRTADQVPVILSLLDRRLERAAELRGSAGDGLRELLDRIWSSTRRRHPAVADLAREVRHRVFDQPLLEQARADVYADVEEQLAVLTASPDGADREHRIASLVACPQPLHNLLTGRFRAAPPRARSVMLEVLTRRYYRTRALRDVRTVDVDGGGAVAAVAAYRDRGRPVHVVTTWATVEDLERALLGLRDVLDRLPAWEEVFLDTYLWRAAAADADTVSAEIAAAVAAAELPERVRRVVAAVASPARGVGTAASQLFTYRRRGAGYGEDPLYRSLHPMMAERVGLWRLRNFRIERLPSVEDVYLFHGAARTNPRDERFFAIAEVRDATALRDASGRITGLPCLERMLLEAVAAIRLAQSRRAPAERLHWNRIMLYVWPPLDLDAETIHDIAHRLAPDTEGLGLEKIVVRAVLPDALGKRRDTTLQLSNPSGTGIVMTRFDTPATRPLAPLSDFEQRVVSMRRRGLVHPYEIVSLLAPAGGGALGDLPPGDFVEHDLDAEGRLAPVQRAWGENAANLVTGVIRNRTDKHPEGMARVIVLGDPSRSLGALAEPECRRIIAALDLAERMEVPVEWFTLSSGARIAMDSGTENMDWIARVLRRIVEFTQAGGEVNLVVNGINVGAQPYWNAEATMLMHTRGVLIMTPDGAMVLTGKQALDYSGSVSAEDNLGIGGYDRIMGPNGQAQYWAPDLAGACRLLLRHYEHTYRAPGERFPRRTPTDDPVDRDAGDMPHPHVAGVEFTRIADIFSDESNPGRKRPFDMRALMAAVVDRDRRPLERWPAMRHADTAIVWDAHLGGHPVCLVGFESRPVQRQGFVPADGPDHWTPGTLFPQSSRKVARAVNAASGNRPVVVLANLSGFDGSPESMRNLQLEFGAEIGRAVVNFRGPIVFCVVSRYHGGAFVVFSAALNESLEVAALEGSYASVIGGAPAAAVVFAREVDMRTRSDPRVAEIDAAVAAAGGAEKAQLRARRIALVEQVRGEKLGQVADEFDRVHTVQRAARVGSVHHIIPARSLRPYLVDAVERGMARELASWRARGTAAVPPPPADEPATVPHAP